MQIEIIRTNGARETHEVPKAEPLKAIAKLVGYPFFDTVNLRDGRVMLVDDEGAIRDPRAPVNAEATKLYHAVCRPGTTWPIRGHVAIARDADFE